MSKIKKVSDKELLLLPHKDIVRFALFCAEQVKEGWKGIPECFVAIETAERWLKGKASAEECRVAAHAAHATDATAYYATYAAYYAANAATNAASYASYAASSAAAAAHTAAYGNPHLIDAQRNYYEELLYFDDIAEKLLLGEIV